MRVHDPGHLYELRTLDGKVPYPVRHLQFVKREGDGYPGNVGSYAGTTTQEVLRALIDRTKYVDGQIHDDRNDDVIASLRNAIYLLECRAAERHGRLDEFERLLNYRFEVSIEDLPTCGKCNHIGCEGTCHS